MSELETFAAHLFNARWQHYQYQDVTSNVTDNSLVMTMDFAENFSCFYQDKAMSAHWTKNQVTIHPIVTFYACPEDQEVMKESFLFISSDLKHDSDAVQHFCEQDVDQPHTYHKDGKEKQSLTGALSDGHEVAVLQCYDKGKFSKIKVRVS